MDITWFTHFLLLTLVFVSTNFAPTTALNVRHKRSANTDFIAMLDQAEEDEPKGRFGLSHDREHKRNLNSDRESSSGGSDGGSEVQLPPIRKFYLNLRNGIESPVAYVYDEDIEGPGSPPTATVLAVSNSLETERKIKKRMQPDVDSELPNQVDNFLDKLDEMNEKNRKNVDAVNDIVSLNHLQNVIREAVDEVVSEPQPIKPVADNSKLLLHYLKEALESKNVAKKAKRFIKPFAQDFSSSQPHRGKLMNVVEKNGFVVLEKEGFDELIHRAKLIDKENTYLTKALTAATMSQNTESNSERDFRLLGLELQELQKAAKLQKRIFSTKRAERRESLKGKNDVLLRERDLEKQARLLVNRKNAQRNELDALLTKDGSTAAEAEPNKQEDNDDEVIYEKDANDEEQCRPLRDLRDDCLAVRQNFGLSMDNDAAELCDAHKICYACGASNGLSPNECDASFVRIATKLCDLERPSAACVVESRGLLVAMQASHLTFGARSMASRQLQCRKSCVSQFLKSMIEKH